jgi:hypothetical protein
MTKREREKVLCLLFCHRLRKVQCDAEQLHRRFKVAAPQFSHALPNQGKTVLRKRVFTIFGSHLSNEGHAQSTAARKHRI